MKVEEGPGAPGQLALDLPSCADNSGLTEAPKKETHKPRFGWVQLLGQGSPKCLSSDSGSTRSGPGEADGCCWGEASATGAGTLRLQSSLRAGRALPISPHALTVRTLFHVRQKFYPLLKIRKIKLFTMCPCEKTRENHYNLLKHFAPDWKYIRLSVSYNYEVEKWQGLKKEFQKKNCMRENNTGNLLGERQIGVLGMPLTTFKLK